MHGVTMKNIIRIHLHRHKPLYEKVLGHLRMSKQAYNYCPFTFIYFIYNLFNHATSNPDHKRTASDHQVAAKYLLEWIHNEAQVKVKVKATNDIPMNTQIEGGGVDVTVLKPAVEGSGWSAPRCGHFNPGKDWVPMV